jgi:hypothetical protein
MSPEKKTLQIKLLHVPLQLISNIVGLLHRPERNVVVPAPVRIRVTLVRVVEVEKREMVSCRVSELGFRLVGFFALRVRSEVRIGNCRSRRALACASRPKVIVEGRNLPESIAAIERISFEHLNSGETMSIFAS